MPNSITISKLYTLVFCTRFVIIIIVIIIIGGGGGGISGGAAATAAALSPDFEVHFFKFSIKLI